MAYLIHFFYIDQSNLTDYSALNKTGGVDFLLTAAKAEDNTI